MKTINKIPVSKMQRATKLVQAGTKVGINYLKYYGDKIVGSEIDAKEKLDKSNANDIYESLKNLKGGPLKLAQMLSMEKSVLPPAYLEKFSLSQFSVPPLSSALVFKYFRKYFGKAPTEVFDTFTNVAVNAASIGQVHVATIGDKKLAVKIQYPGVADSISSDLGMVKPIIMKLFNMKGAYTETYFKEVENKLLEETDYNLELKNSEEIAKACDALPNVNFPSYYPEYSSEKIITMDWMKGIHLSEFVKINNNKEDITKIGQALWDFYMFQIHHLKKVHADPHPGNFLVTDDKELVVLDFGCMKEIPEDFYHSYFQIFDKEKLNDQEFFNEKLYELELLRDGDTEEEKEFFSTMFYQLAILFTEPFQYNKFSFSGTDFSDKIGEFIDRYYNDKSIRSMEVSRGSKHFIYINRAYFGLYHLMNELQCEDIDIYRFIPKSNFSEL